MSPAVSSNLSL